MKRYVILVPQIVRGKSRAPEKNIDSKMAWVRHKPYPYYYSDKDHEILYTKSFSATPENALIEVQRVSEAMFGTFVIGMGKIDHFCVKEFDVFLHDCTDDVTFKVDGSVFKEPIWAHQASSVINNNRLVNWGVISVNPNNQSYAILSSKQRVVK